MKELIERIEAASGPDRELDRDIMIAAIPCDRAPFRYWAPVNENTGYGGVDVERVYYAPHCAQAVAVPHFTASIDAAMALVPNDCGFVMHSPIGKMPSVALQFGDEDHPAPKSVDGWGDYAKAATPALALCAAALRAKQDGGGR